MQQSHDINCFLGTHQVGWKNNNIRSPWGPTKWIGYPILYCDPVVLYSWLFF